MALDKYEAWDEADALEYKRINDPAEALFEMLPETLRCTAVEASEMREFCREIVRQRLDGHYSERV